MESTNLAQIDPGFNFAVTITGLVTLGHFMGVEDIKMSIKTEEYFEGGNPIGQHFIGPTSFDFITLKWGMVSLSAFYDWIQLVQVGGTFRKDVTIYHYGRTTPPKVIRTYMLKDAFPIRWKGPELDSMASSVPVEEIELAYKYMTLTVAPPTPPTP